MKLKHYIYALGLAASLHACNDDFMERYPLDVPTDNAFWTSENDLKLFLNKFYPTWIKGHYSGWSDSNYLYPLPVKGSPLAYGDVYSDNAVRTGNEFSELGENNRIPTGSGANNNGWVWSDLRNVNYFLTHYNRADLPKETLDKYAGEAYFFKSWEYYRKVMIFGDVPWITKELNTDSEELYMPRTPRAEVMDSILLCINKAVAGLPEKGKEESGRLNKDIANFLKARICLFEGTYRKYHTELGLDGSKFLKECETACEALLGKYTLYRGDGETSYYKMFTVKGANAFSDNPEVILGRTYIPDEYGHAFQRYYDQNNSNRQAMGATRGFLEEYLCADGRPIYVGGSEGNYEVNLLFKGYGMWKELDNRDPRLTQTVCRPGEYVTIYKNGSVDLANGIEYPNISYSSSGSTVTGYRFIKHWMGDQIENDAVTKGVQAAIEFRYGELLLMYAEVEYELNGTLTQQQVDMTINALRERAGYDFNAYPTAKLMVGQEPADPRLDKIYREKLDYTVSPLLREIRRERRVELAMENRRYEDLMRWKAGNLFTVPLRGMKFTEEMQALYDGSHTDRLNGGSAAKITIGKDVYLDDEGYIICYPKSPYKQTIKGCLPWHDYRYLWPIPAEEIRLNPNLEQNPGWIEAEADK
ncbi:MAG: RagB/SusD family nutrient uptake outer membrane protein [Bacteroides sp.]|nr:RagB/SusD family nutrient uptake outer membrane protein [Bacteroides sp.]